VGLGAGRSAGMLGLMLRDQSLGLYNLFGIILLVRVVAKAAEYLTEEGVEIVYMIVTAKILDSAAHFRIEEDLAAV